MMQINPDPFPAAALEANRGGRLTDQQRQRLRGLARAGRKDEFIGSAFCAVIGVVLVAAPGLSIPLWQRALAALGFFLVAALLMRAAAGGDSLTKDLRSGRVEKVEGAIGKRTQNMEGEHSRWTNYYLEIAGRTFSVDGGTFRAAPDAGYVSLYVLPRSSAIVNLERLPDRALPAGVAASPPAIAAAAVTALMSGDPVRSAEARADLASIENSMRAEMSAAAVPPPAGGRDPRPLEQAILGTWQTGFMSMSFMPDGTMVATLPGGHQKLGRWSIGADGRLHADTTGHDRGSDAWVAGDILTISQDGQGMAYKRALASQ